MTEATPLTRHTSTRVPAAATAEGSTTETGAPAGGSGGRRLGRRTALIITAAAILVTSLVVWLVAFSPVLGVRSIVVRGTDSLRPADVVAAAAVRHGAPLIRLDTAAIAQRVERLPAVRSASVRTSYPGTVTIQVVERTPVGYLETGSTFTLVDGSGVRYRTVPGRPARLPLFAIPTGEQSTSATAAVAVVAGDLPAGLLGRITSIQAFDATAITLLLTDHRVVRWGTVARSADKAQLLPTLLLQPGTQFDLTNPDQVVVR